MEQLIVANTMLETELYKLLTPEQQQKVDELRRQAMASVKVNFPEW
jgi:Spy/CpxP family protein refolding chaperone